MDLDSSIIFSCLHLHENKIHNLYMITLDESCHLPKMKTAVSNQYFDFNQYT